MKTILMYSPNDLDGVSLYRHWGPMLELEKKGHVKLVTMSNDSKQLSNWTFYKKSHLVFMSRPSKNFEYYFMLECQKYGLPVWIDLDDNLFCIPDDNDAYEYFSQDKAQEFILFCLKTANKVTVATKQLQSFLSKLNVESEIIPNALDDIHLNLKKPLNMNEKVVWRGSKSHMADLLYFEKEIISVIESHRELEWTFMGLNPFFISRKIKDPPTKWARTLNYIDFMRELSRINAPYTFFPLIDSEFNQTRSHNGWLETTLVGGVSLAPDWDSWQAPGIMHYRDKSDFNYKMDKLLGQSEENLRKMNSESFNYIIDNLLLSNVNNKRLEIINNL